MFGDPSQITQTGCCSLTSGIQQIETAKGSHGQMTCCVGGLYLIVIIPNLIYGKIKVLLVIFWGEEGGISS